MKPALFCIFITTLLVTPSVAQINNIDQEVEPIGGISKLSIRYFKIDFTQAQREVLQGQELEFLYSVDTLGVATLEDVNGIANQPIMDSLRDVTLPMFHPRVVNGRKESSVYFMKLTFPKYNMQYIPRNNSLYLKRPLTVDDFKSISKSGRRMDMVIGGMVNGFVGNASRYLGVGGGMKIDLTFTGKNNIGYGMVMSVYGNHRIKDYPIVTLRPQNTSRTTLLIGGAVNKLYPVKERKELTVQLELAYAVQNIVTRTNAQDDYYVQAQGFSPGVTVYFALPLGREYFGSYYSTPCFYAHSINFHAGMRPQFFNLKQASGVMWEVGVSYRLASLFVDEFQLKGE